MFGAHHVPYLLGSPGSSDVIFVAVDDVRLDILSGHGLPHTNAIRLRERIFYSLQQHR